jgi:hypothetical protein
VALNTSLEKKYEQLEGIVPLEVFKLGGEGPVFLGSGYF